MSSISLPSMKLSFWIVISFGFCSRGARIICMGFSFGFFRLHFLLIYSICLAKERAS